MAMIIYNVTTKCDQSIAEAWLDWLRKEHIPDLLQTGCFTHAIILKLQDTDDTEGPTYAVQYHSLNKELFNQYIDDYAPAMKKKSIDKWNNKIISFRTIMEVVH